MSGTGCVRSEHLHPEGRGCKVEKGRKMMEIPIPWRVSVSR